MTACEQKLVQNDAKTLVETLGESHPLDVFHCLQICSEDVTSLMYKAFFLFLTKGLREGGEGK